MRWPFLILSTVVLASSGCALGNFSDAGRPRLDVAPSLPEQAPLIVEAEPVTTDLPSDEYDKVARWADQAAAAESPPQQPPSTPDAALNLPYGEAAFARLQEADEPWLDLDRPRVAAKQAEPQSETVPTPQTHPPRRPTLTNVSLRAQAPARANTNATPTSANRATGVTGQASGDLESFVTALDGLSVDAPFRAQLERRLLLVLSGDYAAARETLELYPEHQQQMTSKLVDLLIAIREDGGGSGRSLQKLADTLRDLDAQPSLRRLSIPRVELCSRVTGFGNYEPLPNRPLAIGPGGAEFVAYVELSGFASRQDDTSKMYESRFDLRVRVVNRVGDVVHDFRAPGISDTCRSVRHDSFIAPLIRIPVGVPPGEYVVRITIEDTIAETVAEQRTSLSLVASN